MGAHLFIGEQMNLTKAKSIIGWMSEPELEILAQFAEQSKLIFEIGSYFGRSTRVLADNTSGQVHAIDSWEHTNYNGDGNPAYDSNIITYNVFRCNLDDHIRSGKVIVNPVNWEDFYSPFLVPDFIFIDGDHRYEHVKEDILKALDYMQKSGTISGHDYNWPGVNKAVNEVFKDVNVKESIWWTLK
jgi:hypothetical protein